MKMNEEYFVKRVYGEIIEGEGVRGRPSVKQINEEDKYWRELSMVRRSGGTQKVGDTSGIF